MKISNMKVLIVHTDLDEKSGEADIEVKRQAQGVHEALTELGAKPQTAAYTQAVKKIANAKDRPELIFNLVEAVGGTDRDMYKAAMQFHNSYVPHTGAGYKSLQSLSDKIIMKRMMAEADILTPMWHKYGEHNSFFHKGEYIVKPIYEHGSHMITSACVVRLTDDENADEVMEKMFPKNTEAFFAERYIDGREFNVSVLEVDGRPVVLPLAEMTFEGFEGKPKIVCEKAKWDENSQEYSGTVRKFDTVETHSRLDNKLKAAAVKCWEIFKLSGYARVDFRVDKLGEPYVLEVNPNPSLAHDAGFFAACTKAGYSFKSVVELIAHAAFRSR
jgi:D-alanine-D-alanine ligase